MDYRKLVSIDAGSLDKEWQDAPSRYMEVVEAQTDAQSMVDSLKDKLEVTEAVLANDIRKNPDKYGLVKLTDTMTKDLVASDPSLIEIRTQLLAAKKQASLLSGLATAMEHRRKALGYLVELFIRNYQSSPTTSTPIGKEAGAKISMGSTHEEIANRLKPRGAKQ